MLYEQEDFIIEGDRSSLSGVATYEVETGYFYDSDLGGSDGVEVTACRLLYVDLDGLRLTRDQICKVLTPSSVTDIENDMCERPELAEAA